MAARVDELLALFGLEAYARQLHRGAVHRHTAVVELACSVGHQPTVLLLDEPAAGIAQREVEALSALLYASATSSAARSS